MAYLTSFIFKNLTHSKTRVIFLVASLYFGTNYIDRHFFWINSPLNFVYLFHLSLTSVLSVFFGSMWHLFKICLVPFKVAPFSRCSGNFSHHCYHDPIEWHFSDICIELLCWDSKTTSVVGEVVGAVATVRNQTAPIGSPLFHRFKVWSILCLYPILSMTDHYIK